MKVRFLGSGDAFGSGGRFQTCIQLQTGASHLLVDCGASSLIAMRRFGVDPQAIDTVLLSHLHGDHFGGVPFLILDGQFRRRTRPLTVAGPPGVEARVRQAMEVFFPGSAAIEKEVLRRVEAGTPFALCYLDLDNLKAYNDHYGYAKADGVVLQTGDLLREVVATSGGPGDFIGHIAGDDFVFITALERTDTLCQRVIEAFDRIIPLYYDKDYLVHGSNVGGLFDSDVLGTLAFTNLYLKS